ncbi:MAG: hypothetical protein K2Z81_07865 [Cyanobacteria bacterium]|nr:hypothetical protein [Cyanobacteriota bacterium]
MRKQRICLFFSDTGGGHRSAAEATRQALVDLTRQVDAGSLKPEILVENIVEKSHPLNRYFVELYNFMLRNNQAGMKYYYWFIEQFKPNDSERGYQLAKPYLEKLIVEIDPSMIVSVHPMSNHYLARVLKDMGLSNSVKLITVVTDPNGDFWKGWACPDVDLTIVPNEMGYQRLIDWDIEPKKIKIAGMPIHPDFIKPPTTTREEFLSHLGLEPPRPTVCINAGWAGGGNMLDIYKAICASARGLQIIFLCGHNRKLYEKVKKMAKSAAVPTAVLPFHDRMSDLMSCIDLMVTKAGGLTSFEAVARRVPMAIDMVTKPMPQEYGTAMLLCQQGLAQAIYKPTDIVPILADLRPRYEAEPVLLPPVMSLDRVDAVYDIAQMILDEAGVKIIPGVREALLKGC